MEGFGQEAAAPRTLTLMSIILSLPDTPFPNTAGGEITQTPYPNPSPNHHQRLPHALLGCSASEKLSPTLAINPPPPPPPMLLRCRTAEEPLDLYVVGGYVGKTCSEALSTALLCVLHKSPRAFRVVLACMSRLNSTRPAASTASTSAPTGDSVPVSQTLAADPPSAGGGSGPSAAGRINGDVAFEGGMQGRDVASEGASSARADVGCVRDPQARQNHPVPTDTSSVKDNDTRHRDHGWLPRQTGLAIDLRSGQAYPVRFEGEGRGPGWEVRSSRVFSGSREQALTEVGALQ